MFHEASRVFKDVSKVLLGVSSSFRGVSGGLRSIQVFQRVSMDIKCPYGCSIGYQSASRLFRLFQSVPGVFHGFSTSFRRANDVTMGFKHFQKSSQGVSRGSVRIQGRSKDALGVSWGCRSKNRGFQERPLNLMKIYSEPF